MRRSYEGVQNPNFGYKWTDEQKRSLSKKLKGRIPWNKGMSMPIEQKKKLSDKIKERGGHSGKNNPMYGKKHSKKTKDKIREKRKKQIITNEQCLRSIETRKKNGHDLAFFRGKKHTEESKEKIRQSSIKNNKIKSDEANERIIQNLKEQNIIIKNINDWLLKLYCKNCNHNFTISKQYCRGLKLNNKLCDFCYPRKIKSSNPEYEVYKWLEELNVDIIKNTRQIIKPMELDLYLPNNHLAIEYCGLYWHSEKYKSRNYHKIKLNLCEEKNIHLITLFADEWVNKKDIVKSRILNNLKKSKYKIYARNCIVKEISSKEANIFLKNNHIQGSGRSNIRYGSYYKDDLVSVMTFSNSNISRKINSWEINRFCTKLNSNVIGIANKLFKNFIKNQNPEQIMSYADRRWSSKNAFYTKLNFKLDSYTPPNYWYFVSNDTHRYHRFALRKNKNDNPLLTEWENRQKQGWNRIWDCGSIKYVWKNT